MTKHQNYHEVLAGYISEARATAIGHQGGRTSVEAQQFRDDEEIVARMTEIGGVAIAEYEKAGLPVNSVVFSESIPVTTFWHGKHFKTVTTPSTQLTVPIIEASSYEHGGDHTPLVRYPRAIFFHSNAPQAERFRLGRLDDPAPGAISVYRERDRSKWLDASRFWLEAQNKEVGASALRVDILAEAALRFIAQRITKYGNG